MAEHAAEKGLLRCRIFGHRWEHAQRAGVWWFACRRCGKSEPESVDRAHTFPQGSKP